VTLILKLSLIPLVVWLATVAGRRFGHAVTGWITGLPLIAGPISIYLALDPGPEFAAKTGHSILQCTAGSAAHCLAFGLAAPRFGWFGSLMCAWATFLVVAWAISATWFPLWLAAACAFGSLAATLAFMPRVGAASGPVRIPNSEVVLRMLFALVIAAAATLLSADIGPRYAAILLTFPISGTVMPAFTRALYGADATIQLLRGFVLGLFGFTAFFIVVPLMLPRYGIVVAYTLGTAVAIATTFIITRLYARLGLHRRPAH